MKKAKRGSLVYRRTLSISNTAEIGVLNEERERDETDIREGGREKGRGREMRKWKEREEKGGMSEERREGRREKSSQFCQKKKKKSLHDQKSWWNLWNGKKLKLIILQPNWWNLKDKFLKQRRKRTHFKKSLRLKLIYIRNNGGQKTMT